MKLKDWAPYIIQAAAVLGAAWTYTNAMEHRLTALEAREANQERIIEQLTIQQKEMQTLQYKLVALEEFIHKVRYDGQ